MKRIGHGADSARSETGKSTCSDKVGRRCRSHCRDDKSERYDRDDRNRDNALDPFVTMTFLSQRVLGASPRLIAASNKMPANGMMTHPEEVLRYLPSRSPKQTDLDSAISSGDGLCPVILAFTYAKA